MIWIGVGLLSGLLALEVIRFSVRFTYQLNKIKNIGESIMAELDDLKQAVADVAAEVADVKTAIDALKALVAAAQNGMVPAADVEAAAQALETSVQGIKDAIK